MKSLKSIATWLLILIYFILISGFIAGKRKQLYCNDIQVTVIDSLGSGFNNSEDIEALILKSENLIGKRVDEINLKSVEESLLKERSIASAETYITEDGKLHVTISHKTPVVRVENYRNTGYYLDAAGNIFPLSERFMPHILFANGQIIEPFDLTKTKNIYNNRPENPGKSKKTIYDLLTLVNYINRSEFWKAQIEQIYVNGKYEFELIPRVGAHFILLGTIDNYTEKFENLKTLYLEGFNKIGWNEYTTINLKFKDQIICTKR